MSGLSDAAETNLLKLLFQNIPWANFGDATGLVGSSVAGNLYISLHTADPTDAGNQSSSEAAYTGYARVAVVRSASGFAISGDTISNVAAVVFGKCTAGSSAVTHFAIGLASSGSGQILGVGLAPLAVSVNITPQFDPTALTAVAA